MRTLREELEEGLQVGLAGFGTEATPECGVEARRRQCGTGAGDLDIDAPAGLAATAVID
jgi:hypothetical protein